MNYEKLYKEALERAKSLYENANGMILRKWVEKVFPELAESDDERIRQEIIDFATKANNGVTSILANNYDFNSWLAWLKKQGKQKPFDYEDANIHQMDFAPKSAMEAIKEEKVDNQNCVKPADKVEPKFKVGDIIRLKDGDGLEWTVEEVLNNGYYIACADRDNFIQLDDKWELVEQKLAWSEEDKVKDDWEYIQDFIEKLGHFPKDSDELNVLTNYVLNKKQKFALNEEDNIMLNDVINLIEQGGYVKSISEHYINWLKSLRPHSQWKPSEEQIRELSVVATGKGWFSKEILSGLLEQLKKLI